MPGIQYLPEGNIDTKKLCGIRITLDKKKETSFAVGSVDDIYGSWDGYDKKLSDHLKVNSWKVGRFIINSFNDSFNYNVTANLSH